ncbi:response regulator [Flammeovirga pectinis]|uniref:Response regulator n=1 Tax=Flammeovirga pectinis TaxID=2494373 RepID=A0A3Q9FT94_9BACT|nr:response regulator [Flammeovirga pectinis]AZQ64097.1 response regulator [Flammeovirga pectinis]
MNPRKFKVYFVEDNPTEMMLMKLALQQVQNVEAKFFKDGNSLIHQFKEDPSDIVVTDLILPDIHGKEIIKILKEQNTQTKLIVMSAQEDVQMIADLQDIGIFNYIVKSDACLKYLQKTLQVACFLIEKEYN